MFVCPDCKTPLTNLFCERCKFQFQKTDDIPVLFTREDRFQSATKIGDAYNDIYAKHTNVWNDQGRTPEFIQYFGALVQRLSAGKVLEIGCGEGFLLAELNASKNSHRYLHEASEKRASYEAEFAAHSLSVYRLRTRASICHQRWCNGTLSKTGTQLARFTGVSATTVTT